MIRSHDPHLMAAPPLGGDTRVMAGNGRQPVTAEREADCAEPPWWRRLVNRLRGYPSRRWLIRHGLRVGRGVYLHERVSFDYGFLWLISIGDNTTLTDGVRILAHDAAPKLATGYSRVGRVDIGEGVFIGADATVLPGVTIGDRAIVGTGAVVRHDVAPETVVMGNPAVEVSTLEEFAAKHARRMTERPRYPRAGFSNYGGASTGAIRRMRRELADGCGYVE